MRHPAEDTTCPDMAPVHGQLDTLDMIMQYGTGPTTVQVDDGSLVHSRCVGIITISSECSDQMRSEQAGDYSSSSKE